MANPALDVTGGLHWPLSAIGASETMCALRYALSLSLFLWVLLSPVSGFRLELPVIEDDPRIGSETGVIHVVTNTECGRGYFEFQSLTLKSTFDKVQQPGRLTRIVSCDREDTIHEEDRDVMDTFIVPSWSIHPVTHDAYSPYNKPVGIIHWLAQRKPTAEWTLIVDPDMQFRQPFLVEDFRIPVGYAASSGYSYLKGVYNALAERHIPHVIPRNDTFGGNPGRRADEAGAYYLIRTRDLVKVAPLWLKFTEAVRDDPNAWNLTGDDYVKPGGKAWISEMYGYIFAAASVNIWHRIDSTIQYYPGYPVRDIPMLTHYGLKMKLEGYVFDKHDHFGFRSFVCPPWDLSVHRGQDDDKGLFPHPPSPHEISVESPRERYGKLMVIEAVNNINAALCARHLVRCAPSEQLQQECSHVQSIERGLRVAFEALHTEGLICHNDRSSCPDVASPEECEQNWGDMEASCRTSCQLCRKFRHLERDTPQRSTDLALEMEKAALEATYKIDRRIFRCAQLSFREFQTDLDCQTLLKEGHAELEDFIGDPLIDSDTTGPPFVWISFLVALLMVSGMLVWRRRYRHSREKGVFKDS